MATKNTLFSFLLIIGLVRMVEFTDVGEAAFTKDCVNTCIPSCMQQISGATKMKCANPCKQYCQQVEGGSRRKSIFSDGF